MQFLRRETDRVLTTEETQVMLLEEAIVDDIEVTKAIRRWRHLLGQIKFSTKKQTPNVNKIRVNAWKEEDTYLFKDIHNNVMFTQEFTGDCRDNYIKQCWLANIPGVKQLEGISVAEIEDVSDKFYLVAHPVKVLLDCGFSLNLVVYRQFFESLNRAI